MNDLSSHYISMNDDCVKTTSLSQNSVIVKTNI